MKLSAVLLAGAMIAAGCGSDDSNDNAGTGGGDVKVGLAFDIGGRGDQSFNDAAARGLDKAKKDEGITAKELSASPGETDAQKEERLRLLADGGFNPVVAVGFVYSAAVAKVAKDFPDTKFAIIDDADAKGANIANVTFAANEGSYLVGAAAALKSKSGNVGFVGGVQVPLIQNFQAGFQAGAKAIKKDIKVQVKYLTQAPDFTGFNDPAKGKTAAEGMYDAGADVIFQVAGGSGGGVFQAAKTAKAFAIGVDSDQYNTADPSVRDVIITSMLKKVDVATFDFIKANVDGKFQAGLQKFDLKADGVGYATSGGKVDDIKTKLDDLKQKIISGEISVPDSV